MKPIFVTLLCTLSFASCAKPPILSAVNFNSGTTDITNPSDERVVDEAAEILASSKWSVILVGLADSQGNDDTNRALSIARAESIAEMLRAKTDVDDKRIIVHGIGEKLAVGESLRERKVEFVFFKDKGQSVQEVVVESGVLSEDFRRKKQAQREERAGEGS